MNEKRLKLKVLQNLTNPESKERKILDTLSKTHSLMETAKALNLSYKTVWNYATNINNTFRKKLIDTKIGGKAGKNATITPYGMEILETLNNLGKSLERLSSYVEEETEEMVKKLLKRQLVITSARNQVPVTVNNITTGNIYALIEAETETGDSMFASITLDSLKTLKIKEKAEVLFLIKASSILISKDGKTALSSENILPSKVEKIVEGAVNSEITLKTAKGTELTATITNESTRRLKLRVGDSAFAVFNAINVIVGV